MIVMGIDPGLQNSAFVVVDTAKRRIVWQGAELNNTAAKHSHSRRLLGIALKTHEAYNEYVAACQAAGQRKMVAGIEDAYVGQYPKAALALGEARGTIIGALTTRLCEDEADYEIHSVAPSKAKTLLSGGAHAPKGQIIQMVNVVYSRNVGARPIDNEHVADAVAVAHAASIIHGTAEAMELKL